MNNTEFGKVLAKKHKNKMHKGQIIAIVIGILMIFGVLANDRNVTYKSVDLNRTSIENPIPTKAIAYAMAQKSIIKQLRLSGTETFPSIGAALILYNSPGTYTIASHVDWPHYSGSTTRSWYTITMVVYAGKWRCTYLEFFDKP